MATNKKTSVKATEIEQPKTVETQKKSSVATESIYTVDDFAKAPQSLNATADIIRATFKFNGLEKATVSEAKELIKKFKEREVK